MSPQVKEASQVKHLNVTGDSQRELMSLQEDKQHLLEQVEVDCSLLLVYILLLFYYY